MSGIRRAMAAVGLGLAASVLAGCVDFSGLKGEPVRSGVVLIGEAPSQPCAMMFDAFDRRVVRCEMDGAGVTRLKPLAGQGPESEAVIERGVPTVFDMHELLVSWNVETPPGTGVRFDLRVAEVGGAWSPWLYLGSWGDVEVPGERVQVWLEDGRERGRVAIDCFQADRPVQLLEYRVRAARSPDAADGVVTLRRIAICTTNRGNPRSVASSVGLAEPPLDVPFRSQKTEDEKLAGRLCSPTSLSMVLAYRGVDLPVQRVAETAYDRDFGIYGNWPRNIQAAFALGVPGYLARIDNWHQVEALLRNNQPIIASIQVNPGELDGAPYESTDGHLIVIRGLTADGVYVNDPAVATAEKGQLIYRRDQMEKVWLERTEGTAYILLPKEPAK